MSEKVKVVIVEDNDLIALDLKRRVENLGYEVTQICATGEDSLTYVEQNPPQLVLMDIELAGEMTGIEAAETLAQWLIPVIYITGNDSDYVLEQAKITEPYGYIRKPVEDRELHINIEIALYRAQAEAELKRRERWIKSVLDNISDAILVTDLDHYITFLNPAAEALLGFEFPKDQKIRVQDIFMLQDEENRPFQDLPFDKVLRQKRPIVVYTSILVCPNGKQLTIDYSASPLKNDSDELIGVVLGFRESATVLA